MSFYFIYIDDYGDSSKKLNDPKQPLFALNAAFVPVENWVSLERELLALMMEIRSKPGLEKVDRLHAVDLYQRTGGYRGQDIELIFQWFEKILGIFTSHQVQYLPLLVNKNKILEYLRSNQNLDLDSISANENYQNLLNNGLQSPAYLQTFSILIFTIDHLLKKLNAHGSIIIDQQDEFQHYASLNTYRAFRSRGLLDRIIENPIYCDSRVQTLLAIPDFSGYVYGGVNLDQIKGKNRPKLFEWFQKFILPQIVDLEILIPFTDPLHSNGLLQAVRVFQELATENKNHLEGHSEATDRLVSSIQSMIKNE